MFGRVFLIVLSVISALWLGYATYDRVNLGRQFSPEYVFGSEDSEVLILQNFDHKELILNEFSSMEQSVMEVINSLNLDRVKRIYISKSRANILIDFKEVLTERTALQLFSNVSKLKWNNSNDVSFGELNGSISQNIIQLSKTALVLNKRPWDGVQYDKNADASILNFKQTNVAVTDVYVKDNGIIEYKSLLTKGVKGIKANDREVFATVIPAGIDGYQFIETDYLRSKIDPEVSKSPLSTWLKYGMVVISIGDQKAIITDYKDGQEPIQVMYDFYKKEATQSEIEFFEGASITKLIAKGRGIYVFQLDDFVVLSSNRSICERVVADYKLGNTLAQNSQKLNNVFGLLPQKVNYRNVNKQERKAESIYDSHLLTTVVGGIKSIGNTDVPKSNTAVNSYVVGSPIKDVFPISNQAFYVITTDNKVLFFDSNGKRWERDLSQSPIGKAELIDVLANDKQQLLITAGKSVHLFDANGNQFGSFPYQLGDNTATKATTFYRWKGNGFFLIPIQNGRLVQLDNQGRDLGLIRTKLNEISLKPIVYTSANKPFIGVYGQGVYEMIQADTKKSFRTFKASNTEVIMKLNNEVKLFGIISNQLVSFDQKGGAAYYDKLNAPQFLQNTLNNGEPMIAIREGNIIKLYNTEGLCWSTVRLPFQDVADIQVYTTTNGATFIAAIDAIENKIYFYKSSGELFKQQPTEGSKLVRYHSGSIFTVVDNLIVKSSL